MSVATDEFSAAWESFFRTTRRLRVRATKDPVEGLSTPQYLLLEILRETDEATVGELADAAGVAAPTATRMLDCLARDEYVLRRHSETDRRAVLVSLTPAGRVALEAAHERIADARRRIFESLDPDDRERAAALLNRLAEAMEAELG